MDNLAPQGLMDMVNLVVPQPVPIFGGLLATAILIILTIQFQISIHNYLRMWIRESKKLQISGYLGRKPSGLETTLMRALFKFKGYVESGRIVVVGRKNLPAERCILVANHIDIGDTDVISDIVGRRQGRFLIDLREVPPAKPEGMIMAMAGAIPVDQSSKRAKLMVMDTAARALVEDGENALLMIFPQGQLDPKEELTLESFKRGTAEIAFRAAMQLHPSEPLWIVPLGIHYNKDAEFVPLPQKILKAVFNRLIPKKHDGTPFFTEAKYEAVAVLGQPIQIKVRNSARGTQRSLLPNESQLLTRAIYDAIKTAHESALAS